MLSDTIPIHPVQEELDGLLDRLLRLVASLPAGGRPGPPGHPRARIRSAPHAPDALLRMSGAHRARTVAA